MYNKKFYDEQLKLPSARRERKLFPVIHCTSYVQILRETAKCHSCGIDGIFLINQGMNSIDVVESAMKLRKVYPTGFLIGINLLGVGTPEVMRVAKELGLDAIWTDNGGVDEESTTKADSNLEFVRKLGWNGLHFGGTAFKYQTPVRNFAKVSKLAESRMEVICTSGPGTGRAADLEKIRVMREATDHPIALASGITPDNVEEYLPYVEYYLVATGISSNHDTFDPEKLKNLQDKIERFNKAQALQQQTANQCDGCMSGIPVENGIHIAKYPSGSMVCDAEKYSTK